ncbi:MAG: hypothetical protein EBQ99_08805, partial [Planctomycetes bacterium]|nr:hypothetical protein [Planctomycetota bacterium]
MPMPHAPSPLPLDAPGVIDLLLEDQIMGLWELLRRFGRAVNERTLADASRCTLAEITRRLSRLERVGLVQRERASRRLPRGGWRTIGDRIVVVHDTAVPAHRALARRMIDAWNQRSRRHIDGPPAVPGSKHWEKRAFTLEHLDEHELEELRAISKALDAFMARVGTRHDGRPEASPKMANYFIAMHAVPISEPAPLPARIALVSKERLASKVTEAKSRATSDLTPRE